MAEQVAAAIEDMGFEVALLQGPGTPTGLNFSGLKPGSSKMEVLLSIQGMTCHSCVKTIESVMRDNAGIDFVSVDLKFAQGSGTSET